MTSLVPPLRAAWLDEPDGLVAPAARDAVLALGFEPVNPVGTGAGGQGPLFVGLGGRHDAWHCRLRCPPGLVSQAGTANMAERSSCAAYAAVRPAFAYVLHDPLAAALHVLHGCAATVLVLTSTAAGPRFAYPVTPPELAAGQVTAREADVLAQLLARRRDAEVAAALVVSLSTVRSHCRALFRKLGVADRHELLALFDC
jgi:DNA-binding CsgD family transcriptional regulator